MRRFASFIAIAFMVTAFCLTPAAAQQGDPNAILQRFQTLYGAGKFAEALVEANKLEALLKARFGTSHANYAVALTGLALVAQAQAKYAEAEAFNKRALAIREKALGANHVDVALTFYNLAAVSESQGKYADAERHYARALAIREKALGANHLGVAETLNSLANVYKEQSKLADAERLYKRALAIFGKNPDKNQLAMARIGNNMGTVYMTQGKHADADLAFKDALDKLEKTLGASHPDVARILDNLAGLNQGQGKYAEAESLVKRALAIREKALGENHRDVAETLYTFAWLHEEQGKYTEAEGLLKRALAIRQKVLGENHPDVARTLERLASGYRLQGRYAEAEDLNKRALTIFQTALGENHPAVAVSLNTFALLHQEQGKYAEAEGLYRRALAIVEKAGAGNADVGRTLNNLGALYERLDKYAEAEGVYKRALGIYQKALGEDHSDVARTLNNLGLVHRMQGKDAEAEGLYRRALVIYEKALGKDHFNVAQTLNNLAVLYETSSQARYAEAEGLYRRALVIYEKALGDNHPEIASTLNNLASLATRRNDDANALAWSRKATAAVIAHARTQVTDARPKAGTRSLVEQRASYFGDHVASLAAAARQRLEPEAALLREGFEIAQWAGQSAAAAALAQMAARQAKGEGALARLVRERQDLERRWQEFDERLNSALGSGDSKLAAEQRRELASLGARLTAVDGRLAKEFPDYALLSDPKPLSIAAAQALLGPDEALFLTLDTAGGTFAWLVTRQDARWRKLPLTAQAIADKVQALRCGLDYEGEWAVKERSDRCLRLLKVTTAPASAIDLLPFDLAVAHELYEGLFGPFKEAIKDKHLLLVPSGALTSLPLHVLVTQKPETAVPASSDYRGVPWLSPPHGMSVLPSVTSLKALRDHAKGSAAPKPYIGFGNPLLKGGDGRQTCPAVSTAVPEKATTRGGQRGNAARPVRGGLGDVARLRAQTPLPESTDELCAVGRTLEASASDILLAARATERNVKALSANGALASYRVLHFATHGLLPHETASLAHGIAEAALLLTPPDRASEEDDGLLTASEITLLRLNADWVIMSACNTAAGDKLGADALSGLARAFFYAGARALLVSHWAVDNVSAVELTTKTFAAMKLDPRLGRAGALERSMQILRSSDVRSAHPANWAPFVLVGEGAAR